MAVLNEMARRWIVRAKDYPSAPGVWGDSATIDLTGLLPAAAVSSVRVRKAMIPMLCYNVMIDNQTLRLTVGGPTYTVTILPGFYSVTSMITAIKAAINAALVATPYVFDMAFSPITYRVSIAITDTSIPAPAPFTLDTTTLAGLSPSILTMMGYSTDPLVSLSGSEISNGAANVVTDRLFYITCDEAKGRHGVIDSLSPLPWHDGIICVVPIETNTCASGDVIMYDPEDHAPWVSLVRTNTNGTITLRIAREEYPTIGSSQVSWVIELEVRA